MASSCDSQVFTELTPVQMVNADNDQTDVKAPVSNFMDTAYQIKKEVDIIIIPEQLNFPITMRVIWIRPISPNMYCMLDCRHYSGVCPKKCSLTGFYIVWPSQNRT